MHALEKGEKFEELHQPILLLWDHSSNRFVSEEVMYIFLNIHNSDIGFPRVVGVVLISRTVECTAGTDICRTTDTTMCGEIGQLNSEEMGKELITINQLEGYRRRGKDLHAELGDREMTLTIVFQP
jgi:hypothetical protein